MYKQGDLWGESEKSPEEAKAEAAEAMARAERHANEMWKAECARVIYRLAQSGTPFTTDEVMTIMGKSGHTTHEPRALGPIVRRATSKGGHQEDRGLRQVDQASLIRNTRLCGWPCSSRIRLSLRYERGRRACANSADVQKPKRCKHTTAAPGAWAAARTP